MMVNMFGTFQGAGSLFVFSSFTFTNASATGYTGPTLSACQTAYSGQTWLSNYFSVTNGVQFWTVPKTGTYRIQCLGASGHGGVYGSAGYGANVQGDVSLVGGTILAIIVGQQGIAGSSYSGGGGGASAVSTSDFSTLYMLAGGGGGGGYSTGSSGINASLSTPGTTDGASGGSAAISGNGGLAGLSSSSYPAGGGGGWLSSGGTTTGVSGVQGPTQGGYRIGSSTPYGGTYSGTINSSIPYGGFGGGGAGCVCGGGGGGYSGGQGGGYATSYAGGGGGGSYITGANRTSSVRSSHGHGSVTITLL